ncbi:MAG: peptidylprolyl isomerase [Actinomycetota bacterium]|nr:peptidylprolyl isomerase [Actinomycetota bacterium]
MATDKRARKREVRAAREEALRRRRNTRLAVFAVILLGLIGGVVFAGRDTDKAEQKAVTPNSSPDAAAEVACGGEPPPEADPQQYDEPAQVLEEGIDYRAVISTSCGDIEMDLFEDEFPKTVNSFVFLARESFYDGLTFHRIVANFVIQGGDPEGTGGGGPGYDVPDEFPNKGNVYEFGVVAMANAGPGTTGSQFFVVTHLDPNGNPAPAGLDPLYSLLGRVDNSSFEVIRDINQQETFGGNDPARAEQPIVPVFINSVEIIEA